MLLLTLSQKPSQVCHTSYRTIASRTKHDTSQACEHANFNTENTVTSTTSAQKAIQGQFAPDGKSPYIQFPHPPRPPTPGPQPRPGPLGPPRPPGPTPPPSPRRSDAGSTPASLIAISVSDIRKLLVAILSPDYSETGAQKDCSGEGSIPGRIFWHAYLDAIDLLASAAGSGLLAPQIRYSSLVLHSPLGVVETVPSPLMVPVTKPTVLVY